jgi:hypothetical protein
MRFGGTIRNILVMIAAALTLSACGESNDCKTEERTAVVLTTDVYNLGTLECSSSYTPIEIGVGVQTEKNAKYEITEVRGEEYPYKNVQKAIKLHLQPPADTTISSAIVNTANSDDKELRLNVGANGTVDMEVKTAEYANSPQYYYNYPINSITLCTKRTS